MKCKCGTLIDTTKLHSKGVVEIQCRCGRIYKWNNKSKSYKEVINAR